MIETKHEFSPALTAVYARMPTEHHQESTRTQLDVIRKSAMRRRLKIVAVYSDNAQSGSSDNE